LKEEQRPTVTFNYSEKMIDAVVGAEVSNRQEVRYAPRTIEDAPLAELWTNAAKWVRDECNAEDEETDAFRDALICGLGWTETRISYDEDPDGRIYIERRDPFEMYPDPAAMKPGIVDRRYHFRVWWADKDETKKTWPDADTFPDITEMSPGIDTIRVGHRYEDDEMDDHDQHKDQVQIRFYECVERESYYRVQSPQGLIELDTKTFNEFHKQFDDAGITYIKQYRNVYYRAFFAGDKLLKATKSPIQTGFTIQAITAKRDRNKNTWYGITRVMKDPQRWANKWLSQILHIINSNAKGGLLAEINAFVDPTKAQDEWAKPNSITLLKEGAIGKVQPKQATPYPQGLDRLMEFALSSLPMVTGINLEALGLANREQASILETQRKQAAYGLLSPLFDALRRYRKNQGRVLLTFIHEFISDGRLVRIGGPESQQYLPLTKQPGAPVYDIIVDQSPNAPDAKTKTWDALTQILPAMMKAGLPIPPDLLDYTPLPSALSAKWKAYIAQQSQQKIPPQLQQQMQQMQQQLQQLAQENQQLKADQSAEQQTLVQKAQLASRDQDFKEQLALREFQLKAVESEREFALEQRKTQQQLELAERKNQADIEIKAMSV
ncbi:MAG: hypothetical protein ACRD2L_26115, partial [Terriglobia bacterium]